LVELNFAVAGVLDFPQKRFSLDASLHDSHLGDFPISGDMAMRVGWGGDPNFTLSVGGFHPAFKPPAGFPSLARVSVDLGRNGNPSLTLSGYLALTSNTAQVGARAELNASGAGLRLHGFVGFDALFIFSPFSFTNRRLNASEYFVPSWKMLPASTAFSSRTAPPHFGQLSPAFNFETSSFSAYSHFSHTKIVSSPIGRIT